MRPKHQPSENLRLQKDKQVPVWPEPESNTSRPQTLWEASSPVLTCASSSQTLEEIHVVVLHKDEGAGLGFSVAGGADHENKAATVWELRTASMLLTQ